MNLGLVSVLTASPFEVFLQPTLTWPFVSLYIFHDKNYDKNWWKAEDVQWQEQTERHVGGIHPVSSLLNPTVTSASRHCSQSPSVSMNGRPFPVAKKKAQCWLKHIGRNSNSVGEEKDRRKWNNKKRSTPALRDIFFSVEERPHPFSACLAVGVLCGTYWIGGPACGSP